MNGFVLPLFALRSSSGQIDKNARTLFKENRFRLVHIFVFGWYDKCYFLDSDFDQTTTALGFLRSKLGLQLKEHESNLCCVVKKYCAELEAELFALSLKEDDEGVSYLNEKGQLFFDFCTNLYSEIPRILENMNLHPTHISLAIAMIRYEIGIKIYKHEIA